MRNVIFFINIYKTKYIEKLTLHHEKDQLCSKHITNNNINENNAKMWYEHPTISWDHNSMFLGAFAQNLNTNSAFNAEL